jgi:hypothetical protein
MFDHRAIFLCFKPPPSTVKPPTISREILKDPDIDLIVNLSIYETYLRHTNTLPEPARHESLLRIGRARTDFREAGPDSSILPSGTRTDYDELRRSGLLVGVKEILDGFDFTELSNGGFTENLSDDIFMETLVNNLRNDVVSYQIFISKTIKNTSSETLNKLADLKHDFERNVNKIIELENKLDRIQDQKLRSKLESSKNFEIFNSEKITPNFISLSKGSKSEANLSDLRDDNNLPFNSDEHMKEYVRNFYKNLYKSPPCELDFNENCINDFLGNENVQSRLVQDSIIPEQLSQDFEL